MVHDHLGSLDVDGALLQPLGNVPVRATADIKQKILDVVELMIVTILVVDIVTQILQIFHSRTTSLREE